MDKYEIKPVVLEYVPVFVSIKEMQDNRNENEEEYDSQKRDWRVEVFKDLPISYALGALTFFLQFGLMLQRDLVSSTQSIPMTQKKETIQMLEKAIQSVTTMGGSILSKQLEKDLSSLQEKNQSLN